MRLDTEQALVVPDEVDLVGEHDRREHDRKHGRREVDGSPTSRSIQT
jgi:hypothetical protein